MTNNLKIEVLVSNIPEDGSIASQFPSQEYVNQQLAKKANLSPEGRLDPAQAPDYTEIPGLYEHIEDTKGVIETSISLSLQDAKGYTNQQLSTGLQTKADLVNGKIPFDQIPFSADIEEQIQINVENITAVVDQKVAQVVEQVNGVATAANSYTDTKVAENKTYVDTTIGNVIEDVTIIVDTKAVSKAVTIPTYLTPEAGVAASTGVAAGAYFNVRSTEYDTALVEYQNVGGGAVATGKSYSSGNRVETIAGYTALPFKQGRIYALYERVQLDNGDIVKSTLDANTNDPNVDMTGWVNFEADQQILNNKYSKFKQPEAGSVERDLSVRARDVQYGTDYSTLQNAVDAQRSATSDITLGIKAYTLAAPLNIKGYAYIKGSGFYSDLKFSGAGNGIVYTGTGLQDDHGQRKLSDFQIRGDNTVGGYLGVKTGTTIGYQHTNTGHFSETNGLLLNGHATGLKIENGYTNRNIYNYYRANKVGLHLKNFTSHREESIYARFNDEAGVLLEGTFQNLTIAGGAIEGNHGRGLWAKNLTVESFPKIVLDDVYFESDGDKAAGVPAIEIEEHPRLHVDVRAGSYWNNVLAGITTGIYKWGNSVSFNATTMNGFHYAKRMRVKDCLDYATYNSDLTPTESIANGLVEPVMMLEYSPSFRVNGRGPIFQVPLSGRPTRKLLAVNEATLTYPHILSKSASTTTTENLSLDYGDGSWTDIGFDLSGDYQNNYAQLTNLLDATSEYVSKVFVFLLKPTADCQIGIVSTGTAATHQNYFQLKAGVTYRMCCFANNSAAGDYRMRLFSINGAATISYLPIYLAKFKTTQEGINFANMFATGAL